MNSCFQLSTEATSKVGVVKVSVFGGSWKSSSVQSESGDLVRDSIRDSWATYFVNSSKLTLPSSSVWVDGCGRGGAERGYNQECLGAIHINQAHTEKMVS